MCVSDSLVESDEVSPSYLVVARFVMKDVRILCVFGCVFDCLFASLLVCLFVCVCVFVCVCLCACLFAKKLML